MSVITLDFETFYRGRKNKATEGPRYSLSGATGLTYEEYIRNPEFKVHGVGIKINQEATRWVGKNQVQIAQALDEIFTPGNDHILICHNTMFDAAILAWYYSLRAQTYYCTQAMSRAIWQSSRHSLKALVKRCAPDMAKGTELADFDGHRDLTPEQNEKLGGYCINDVDMTFACFAYMHQFFPAEELALVDLTLRMFIHPSLLLDGPRVKTYQAKLEAQKTELIAASGMTEKQLSSSPQFAALLESRHGIIVPKKHSPTAKNPDNHTWALSKDDLEFQKLMRDNDDMHHLWDARLVCSSSGDRARCTRLLSHAQVSPINPAGNLSMPLTYAAAHTLRFGGTNKINVQNFKRGGELRKSLIAPEGYQVVVADLSNIESRMLAWFANCTQLLEAYAAGRDIYSEFASKIYKRPIDRKYKFLDEAGNYLDKQGNVCDKDDAYCPDWLEGFVGKVAVLGLGFGMGHDKFLDTLAKGALGGPPVIMDYNVGYHIVRKLYRGTYVEIPRLWKHLTNIIRDIATPNLKPYMWNGLVVEPYRLRLPNGLYLNYPGLKSVFDDDTGDQHYEYWNGKYWKTLYGGLLTENIVQALARIVMTEQMLHIEQMLNEKYEGHICLTVHDEVVSLVPTENAKAALADTIALMRVPPRWCNDGRLVLDAEGAYAPNYSK